MSIIIHGKNLAFARLLNGISLDDLAKKVNCSKQYLNQIEKKEDLSSYNDEFVDELSKILGVTNNFFIENKFNIPASNSFYFRSQKTTSDKAKIKMKYLNTVISSFFAYIRPLYNIKIIDVKKHEHKSNNDIEIIAENQRKQLGLSIDTPINNMFVEMERMGFKIIEYKNNLDYKIDACFSDNEEKVILINYNKITSSCRYRFSLAHELGHSLLHVEYDDENEILEDEANYFASAFLLPRIGFLKEFSFLDNYRINWHLLYELKKRWKVSVQAILKRALTLDLINITKYTSAIITMAKNGEKLSEKYDDIIPLEKSHIMKQYEESLQKDYYVINSFIRQNNISLEYFNKILNFNIIKDNNCSDDLIYINRKC